MATNPVEPLWTDLPLDERQRRLTAPVTVLLHGRSYGWSGANTNENRKDVHTRVMARDQWYEPWQVEGQE